MSETGMLRSYASMFGRKVEYPKVLVADYDVRSFGEEVVDGKIMKRSKVKTIHPQDMFKGVSPSDFALENIIAVGAQDSLKEGYLSGINSAAVSDSLETPIDNILSAVDSEVNVKSEGE